MEIALQTEGPLAAVWPEIHAQLGIHPGQQPLLAEVEAQLRSGFSTYSRSMTDIVYGPDRRASGPVSPEEMQEKIAGHAEQFERLYADFEANRERAVKEVTRILTRRQKDRLNQMMGEPYDVSDLQLPGGGN